MSCISRDMLSICTIIVSGDKYLKSVLILSSHLLSCFLNSLFRFCYPKSVFMSCISRDMPDLCIIIVSGDMHRLWSCSLCNLLHFLVTFGSKFVAGGRSLVFSGGSCSNCVTGFLLFRAFVLLPRGNIYILTLLLTSGLERSRKIFHSRAKPSFPFIWRSSCLEMTVPLWELQLIELQQSKPMLHDNVPSPHSSQTGFGAHPVSCTSGFQPF
jgi:hypothetical protein